MYEVQYEMTENNDFIKEQEQQTEIRIVQKTRYESQGQPQNIIFQSSIEQKEQQTIVKVFQLKNKELILQQSQPQNLNNVYQFKQVGTIKEEFKVELNDQIFVIWEYGKKIVKFATLVNEYQINIYRFILFQIELVNTIQFPNLDGQQILSILNQGEYIFILQKNGVLSCYSEKELSLVNSINRNDLIGYGGLWKPLKLYGNRMLKSNIIFVQNEDNIVLINYINSEFSFIKSIDYIQNSEIYISAAKDSFFLVNNKEIFEYNYQNLLNIFKAKTVELFGYSIVNPISATTQFSTGNLIIKTTKAKVFYLNIFKPSLTQHDTFYFAFQIFILTDTFQFTMSIAGDDQMLISVNQINEQIINQIEQSPLLVFDPKFDEKNYFQNVKVSVTMKGQNDENNQVIFQQTVKLVNTFSQLSVKNSNSTIKTNSSNTIAYPVETAIGQNILTTFKTLIVTQGNITFNPLIQPITRNIIPDYQINYGYSKDNSSFQQFSVYLQAKNTLLIGTNQGDDLSYVPAEYTLPNQYNCFRLDNYKDRLFSICNNGVENELVLSNCINKKCQLINSYIPISNGNQVIAPYDDYVIVLFYNPLNPQDQDGEYKIYKIIHNDGFHVSLEVMQMNLEFIKQNINKNATKYRPSGMTGVGVEINTDTYVYLLMVTNCYDELMFNNYMFTNGDIQPTGMSQISLKELLKKQVTDQTLFLSTQIKSSLYEKDILTVELVILTSDSGTFQIMMKFKYNKDQMKFENQQQVLTRTFIKYGDWKVLNYLTVDSSSIGVAYYKENQVTVGIYQILKESPYYLTTGGYQFKVSNQQDVSPLNFLMLLQTNYLFSGNPNDKGLIKYKLNTNSSIVIKDPQKQQKNNLTLTFSNDFSEVESRIALEIIPNNDDDTSKGLGAVWIVLIVLGSLVCLSLIGYAYYKSQDPNKEEEAPLV